MQKLYSLLWPSARHKPSFRTEARLRFIEPRTCLFSHRALKTAWLYVLCGYFCWVSRCRQTANWQFRFLVLFLSSCSVYILLTVALLVVPWCRSPQCGVILTNMFLRLQLSHWLSSPRESWILQMNIRGDAVLQHRRWSRMARCCLWGALSVISVGHYTTSFLFMICSVFIIVVFFQFIKLVKCHFI